MDIEKFLPENLKGKYQVQGAHLLKVGYVPVAPVAGLKLETPEAARDALRQFAQSLYDAFEKSLNVLEIQPPRKEGLQSSRGGQINKDRVSLLDALDLRISLSEHQRREFRGALGCPEQFSISYDGGVFFAWAAAMRVPEFSGVGQAAREFLKKAVEGSPDSHLKLLDWGGPSPIHPDIYMIAVAPMETRKERSREEMLSAATADSDLMVLYSSEITIREAVRNFRRDCLLAFNSFFGARAISWSIDDRLQAVEKLNEQLSNSLAELFKQRAAIAMIRGIPRRIRHLLSQLHLELQEVSRLELRSRECVRQMNSALERDSLFAPLSPYLNKYADEHHDMDKETQLRFMDYAGSEAVNVRVVQATVWASIIGAAVGSAMTLFFK